MAFPDTFSDLGSPQAAWAGVACSNNFSLIFGCVPFEAVYRSDNGGTNFSAIAGLNNFEEYVGVACSSDGQYVTVVTQSDGSGGAGSVYVSSDYGVIFSAPTTPPGSAVNAFTCVAMEDSGQTQFLAGYADKVYRSQDYGDTWQSVTTIDYNYRAIACSATQGGTGEVYVVVYGGKFYQSTNSGTNWGSKGVNQPYTGVSCSDDGAVVVATTDGSTSYGRIWLSTNYGTSVSAVSASAGAGTKAWYGPGVSPDGSKLIAFDTSNYEHLASDNGGSSWYAPDPMPIESASQTRIVGTDEIITLYSPPSNAYLQFSVTVSNQAPTDISLSANTVAENAAINTVVGTLSTTDPDAGDTFTYTLVAGTGGDDNASFNISGTSLRTSASFNYESKSSYTVRVRSTDAGSLYFEKAFTITVTNVNETPTDINLSNNAIAENNSINDVVGTLSTTDPDSGNTFTYTLVSGTGDTDNASFNINSNELRASAVFDYETKSSYTVRVRSTDQGGLYVEEAFTINVTGVNEAPTDISLSANTIAEGNSINDTIGTFTTTDPDSGNTFTYTLVAGTGDTDNSSFNISSDALRASEVFDYETKNSYSIRVRSTDQGSLYFEKVFTINVTNVNEAPTDITLSNSTIAENNSIGDTVGTFTTTDPDSGNTFTYTLVSGTGDTDNASFTIDVDALKAAEVFDYETKSTYYIRVRSTDQGSLYTEKEFTITVTDVTETTTPDESIPVVPGLTVLILPAGYDPRTDAPIEGAVEGSIIVTADGDKYIKDGAGDNDYTFISDTPPSWLSAAGQQAFLNIVSLGL